MHHNCPQIINIGVSPTPLHPLYILHKEDIRSNTQDLSSCLSHLNWNFLRQACIQNWTSWMSTNNMSQCTIVEKIVPLNTGIFSLKASNSSTWKLLFIFNWCWALRILGPGLVIVIKKIVEKKCTVRTRISLIKVVLFWIFTFSNVVDSDISDKTSWRDSERPAEGRTGLEEKLKVLFQLCVLPSEWKWLVWV